MAGKPMDLRKPAQRPAAASRTVEVGGRGGWVRGRAMAAPEERESSRGAVGGGGGGEHGELTDEARRGARGAAGEREPLGALPGAHLADFLPVIAPGREPHRGSHLFRPYLRTTFETRAKPRHGRRIWRRSGSLPGRRSTPVVDQPLAREAASGDRAGSRGRDCSRGAGVEVHETIRPARVPGDGRGVWVGRQLHPGNVRQPALRAVYEPCDGAQHREVPVAGRSDGAPDVAHADDRERR